RSCSKRSLAFLAGFMVAFALGRAIAGEASHAPRLLTIEDVLHREGDFGGAVCGLDDRGLVFWRDRGFDDASEYYSLSCRGGEFRSRLFLVHLDQTAAPKPLFEDAPGAYRLGPLSPDGTRVLFIHAVGGRTSVGVYDLRAERGWELPLSQDLLGLAEPSW